MSKTKKEEKRESLTTDIVYGVYQWKTLLKECSTKLSAIDYAKSHKGTHIVRSHIGTTKSGHKFRYGESIVASIFKKKPLREGYYEYPGISDWRDLSLSDFATDMERQKVYDYINNPEYDVDDDQTEYFAISLSDEIAEAFENGLPFFEGECEPYVKAVFKVLRDELDCSHYYSEPKITHEVESSDDNVAVCLTCDPKQKEIIDEIVNDTEKFWHPLLEVIEETYCDYSEWPEWSQQFLDYIDKENPGWGELDGVYFTKNYYQRESLLKEAPIGQRNSYNLFSYLEDQINKNCKGAKVTSISKHDTYGDKQTYTFTDGNRTDLTTADIPQATKLSKESYAIRFDYSGEYDYGSVEKVIQDNYKLFLDYYKEPCYVGISKPTSADRMIYTEHDGEGIDNHYIVDIVLCLYDDDFAQLGEWSSYRDDAEDARDDYMLYDTLDEVKEFLQSDKFEQISTSLCKELGDFGITQDYIYDYRYADGSDRLDLDDPDDIEYIDSCEWLVKSVRISRYGENVFGKELELPIATINDLVSYNIEDLIDGNIEPSFDNHATIYLEILYIDDPNLRNDKIHTYSEEGLDEELTTKYTKETKQGYKIYGVYSFRNPFYHSDKNTLYAIFKENSGYAIAENYDTSDGTWSSGNYGFATEEDAINQLRTWAKEHDSPLNTVEFVSAPVEESFSHNDFTRVNELYSSLLDKEDYKETLHKEYLSAQSLIENKKFNKLLFISELSRVTERYIKTSKSWKLSESYFNTAYNGITKSDIFKVSTQIAEQLILYIG